MDKSIPETMKALVLPEAGKYEVKDGIPVPKPEPFEVLCRVRAVAICGSDPELIHGGLAGYWPPSYPFIPGHEWAGEVVAVG
jgi:L-iditol 2-dehydrogenase